MAGNKFNTSFGGFTPDQVTISYENYLGKTEMTGTMQQIMNHLFTIGYEK